MAIRVDFRKPIDGGGGRVDLMRVVADSGFVADDFDARVIFSSAYPSAQFESFSASINSFPDGTASGSFTLSRPYKTHPILFPVYVQNNGSIWYLYFYNQYFNSTASNGTVTRTLEQQELVACDVVPTGGNNFRIDYRITSFGANNNIGPGVLYVKAVGQGT